MRGRERGRTLAPPLPRPMGLSIVGNVLRAASWMCGLCRFRGGSGGGILLFPPVFVSVESLAFSPHRHLAFPLHRGLSEGQRNLLVSRRRGDGGGTEIPHPPPRPAACPQDTTPSGRWGRFAVVDSVSPSPPWLLPSCLRAVAVGDHAVDDLGSITVVGFCATPALNLGSRGV